MEKKNQNPIRRIIREICFGISKIFKMKNICLQKIKTEEEKRVRFEPVLPEESKALVMLASKLGIFQLYSFCIFMHVASRLWECER
jgi:hypothetical protein